jgi:hypothetical protein
MYISKIFLSIVLVISSPATATGAWCTDEKITDIILTTSGVIQFQTNKSCLNTYCNISTSVSADYQNRVFALLLTQYKYGSRLNIYWPNANFGCELQPTNSVPSSITTPVTF